MPDNISTRLLGLIENCRTLKRKIDANTLGATQTEKSAKDLAEEIKTAADRLKDEFEEIREAAKKTIEKIERNRPAEISTAFAQLEALLGGLAAEATTTVVVSTRPSSPAAEAPEDEVGLKNFLADVSTSLIDAQKELNRQSLDYAAHLDPQIPPVHYAIPNLKAEMRVGFRETKGRGINLILFSSKTQRENFGESVVTFELAAVPPPAARLVDILPLTRVIVVGEERNRILDWLVQQQISGGHSPFAMTTYANTREMALILRFFDEERKDYRYLVLWPSQQRNARKAYWRELAVISLKSSGDQFEFDLSIFDDNYPRQDFLLIPSATELRSLEKEALIGMVFHLGDVLMTNVLIINDWMKRNNPES